MLEGKPLRKLPLIPICRETIGPSLEGLPSDGGVLGKARWHLTGSILPPQPPSFSMSFSPAAVWPVVMLFASNIFMTFAWYGHLKHKSSAIFLAIIVSWGIAFFEYCLAVPANRIGSAVYTTAQLKTMQEVITLIVFSGFSIFWLGENLTWNHAIGFALIAIGASFIFRA
ncbi:uncharacterized protein (DUF486 family) [Rhizobium leguminosarum]|jgi:uncharacterized protein (DUF486 family)